MLDYSLPLVNGIEATRQIRSRLPRTEVLIFTMHDNEALIEDALKAGARGYLLKSDAKRNLIAAIESLASHKPFFASQGFGSIVAVLFDDIQPIGIDANKPTAQRGPIDRRRTYQ